MNEYKPAQRTYFAWKCTQCGKKSEATVSFVSDDPYCHAEVCKPCLEQGLALFSLPDPRRKLV